MPEVSQQAQGRMGDTRHTWHPDSIHFIHRGTSAVPAQREQYSSKAFQPAYCMQAAPHSDKAELTIVHGNSVPRAGDSATAQAAEVPPRALC